MPLVEVVLRQRSQDTRWPCSSGGMADHRAAVIGRGLPPGHREASPRRAGVPCAPCSRSPHLARQLAGSGPDLNAKAFKERERAVSSDGRMARRWHPDGGELGRAVRGLGKQFESELLEAVHAEAVHIQRGERAPRAKPSSMTTPKPAWSAATIVTGAVW